MSRSTLPTTEGSRAAGGVLAAALLAGVAVLWAVRDGGEDPLVVYCAHDSIYSEAILREFERRTGIPLAVTFDTDAARSLGLTNLIIQQRDHPQCDVFWNNQVLTTVELQRQGLLEPYRGPGWGRIPDAYKDPQGYWTGFAARLRVYIVNIQRLPANQPAVDEAMSGDLRRMAVARPLYGTTLSHYALLWHRHGGDEVKRLHFEMRRRNIVETAGNAQVRHLVASGVCDFGWTDTDDYFVAKDDGVPVQLMPIRVDGGTTVCIPNSVAIIKGTTRRIQAERLVDFLLSADTELKLARCKSRQIPLGPVDESRIPGDVRQLRVWAADGARCTPELADSHAQCLQWLTQVYPP